MEKFFGLVLLVVFCIALFLGLTFGIHCLFGLVLMAFWNYIIANLFPVAVISFWESVGLAFLISLVISAVGIGARKKVR